MKTNQQNVTGFENRVEAVASAFFSFWDRHKVGILGTISFNMILAILFFVFELKTKTHIIDTIIQLDFDREYEIRQPEEEHYEPLLPADALSPEKEWEAIKNIAVDATREDLNPDLTDEKNINADDLYEEALRVREQMQSNKELWEESKNAEELSVPNIEEKNTAPKNESSYKGPTVISYFLEGRKAIRLPVPSYKCQSGGQVVVDIEVLSDGSVSKATLDAANSVQDECIANSAIQAAMESRFTSASQATARQKGSITYLYVPQ